MTARESAPKFPFISLKRIGNTDGIPPMIIAINRGMLEFKRGII